jgi:hypothetical protein
MLLVHAPAAAAVAAAAAAAEAAAEAEASACRMPPRRRCTWGIVPEALCAACGLVPAPLATSLSELRVHSSDYVDLSTCHMLYRPLVVTLGQK